MKSIDRFYIDGQWVKPSDSTNTLAVVNPATEETFAMLTMGNASDVDRAVTAARAAFSRWSRTSREERIALLERVIVGYTERMELLADAISTEMGAPLWMAREYQVPLGLVQLKTALEALRTFQFEKVQDSTEFLKEKDSTLISREPIGVAALITPWNWPINQITAKVAPALAAGCTVVLKPSEIAPLDARIFAEIMHEAGAPAGIFNMVFGDGSTVGSALSSHPGVDVVSITGSTRAGVQVALNAAPTVKRVTQELGGKSANIILDDADLEGAVSQGVLNCMLNSGQTCTAPTRMLVARSQYENAIEIAQKTVAELAVGDPLSDESKLGPISNRTQYEKVRRLIEQGIEEGARLVAGGPDRPDSLVRGFYIRPTIFADVNNRMTIAREEIFGPVLVIIPYDDEEGALAIANDSEYGLAGYVSSSDLERARRVASRMHTGAVYLNGSMPDFSAPFGGFKKSGNGREYGEYGLADFLEYKSVMGYAS